MVMGSSGRVLVVDDDEGMRFTDYYAAVSYTHLTLPTTPYV